MDMRKTLCVTNGRHQLGQSEDIISNLNEDVILYILSFLDIKAAVVTSLLSRRWRYLWSSLRVLNFDQRFYPWFKKYPFKNSLDKVINVLRNVQEIHLKLSSELPQCIFNWKSLRVLKLKGVDGFLWLRNPHSVDLPLLKSLHLTRVVLDMTLVNDCLSKCPALEVLSLKCCEFMHLEDLIVSSPQLKKLVIITYDQNYGCFKHYDTKIWAPKLTFLKVRDYISKRFSLDNLSSLESAVIDLKVNEHFVPLGTKQENAKRVIQVLEGLCHAESLTLSASSLEMFSSALKIQRMSSQFSNLRHFKLTSSPNDACDLLQLLMDSPNIKTLLLKMTWTNFNSYQGRLYWDEVITVCFQPSFYSTIMEANWEEWLQFQCLLEHLESVEIRNFLGCENEVRLLIVLLQKATALRKIKIVLAQVWPHSREKMMWVVWKILQRVPRASQNIMLEFVNFRVLKL
ncbi:hypothetical protein IFM89_023048 [Coptis chinensis]|uniref:F-box domain-containing protein n=1 Tax=Coptis chinensis TaxID=261450 RepID=A0A835M3V1_9MAGN|nr:hypothetical protein IFM89_023048 [Coptis chinensis]